MTNLLEKSHEQKLSTLHPSSNGDDREAGNDLNKLPEIIESENKNSSADFEYSSDEIDQSPNPFNTRDSAGKNEIFSSKRDSGVNYGSTRLENVQNFAKNNPSRNHQANDNLSDLNPLKTSRRNPSDLQASQFSKKEFESELNTQLNMGSPVQGARMEKLKQSVKPKRPNSANVKGFKVDSEPLQLDSLISIKGVKRHKCKVNLNGLLNSKEVQSNYGRASLGLVNSRPSSTGFGSRKQKALVTIQKNLRMFQVRVNIERQKELRIILNKGIGRDDQSERRGQGLKMSDLSYTPKNLEP